MKAILIEDNKDTRQKCAGLLTKASFEVEQVSDVKSAEKALLENHYELIILDLELDGDKNAGIGIINTIRTNKIETPILIVSGMDELIYRDVTLHLGVFDYLVKPINEDAFVTMSKLLATEKLSNQHVESTISSLDMSELCAIRWKGEKVALPLTAWKLTQILVQNAGKPVLYNDLYDCVKTGKNNDNIRSHIKIIRNKFIEVDSDFNRIIPITGRGYMWVKED